MKKVTAEVPDIALGNKFYKVRKKGQWSRIFGYWLCFAASAFFVSLGKEGGAGYECCSGVGALFAIGAAVFRMQAVLNAYRKTKHFPRPQWMLASFSLGWVIIGLIFCKEWTEDEYDVPRGTWGNIWYCGLSGLFCLWSCCFCFYAFSAAA